MFVRLLHHPVSLQPKEDLRCPPKVEMSPTLYVASVQSSLQVSAKLVERAVQTFSSSVQETGICRGCS